jgi:uncharacterized protein DUF4145
MRCPHCSVAASITWVTATSFTELEIKSEPEIGFEATGVEIAYAHCPECEGLLVILRHGEPPHHDGAPLRLIESEERIYPAGRVRALEPEVPESYRIEFLEACKVEGVSPKASAALSRRLLQQLFRDGLNLKSTNLATQVQGFLELPGIPSYLSEAVDAVRNIGNFAAHPLKATRTGEIVDVELGEAAWLLDVLEALFDFVFVQPVRLAARKAELNTKLASFGKPPMKTSP